MKEADTFGVGSAGKVVWLLASAMLATAASADQFLNRPGWKMTFQDEFTGSGLKTNKWTAQNAPNLANEELQFYTPECVIVTNGQLLLLSKNEGVWDGSTWWPYKSGKVVTAHQFDQQYGRFEVRAKLPFGKGFWPAHWMLGYNGWPPEIDFMELIGSVPWRVTVGYHWGPAPPPPLYPWDVGQTANRDIWAGDWTLDYHTFAVEWDWWGIKFYIDDGEVFASYNQVPHEPMYLILNTAVGGQWPGSPDWTTPWPGYHWIDYARIYERNTANVLLNESFESGEEGTFADWNMLESGNLAPDSEPLRAHSGTRSATLTGRNTGAANSSFLFQSLPAAAGEIWQAGVWVDHRADEPLQGTNRAQLKLEFLDGFGVFLAQPARTIAVSNTPSGYTHYTIRAKAPTWTTHARVTVGYHQYDNAAGRVNVDDLQLAPITADGARSLANGGFEEDEAGQPVSWVRFGTAPHAAVDRAVGSAHEGLARLRLAAATNITGVLQDLPARAGEPWIASVWARNDPDQPLAGADVVRAKLEFVNSAQQVIAAVTQTVVNASTPAIYTNHLLAAAAPVGTAYARIVLERTAAGGSGAASLDGAALYTSADAASLLNPSFEQFSGSGFPAWSTYGSGINVVRDTNAAHARSGTNAVQVFGQFNGVQNESGIFQDVEAEPGEVWEASVWAQNRPGDVLQGLNRAYLKIEFRDAGDALLDSDVADAARSNSPAIYQKIVVRRAAPPNTAKVRIVMALVQQNNSAGAVNFDDPELRRLTVHDSRFILNGDFEQSEGTRIVNWSRYPAAAANLLRDPVSSNALGGGAAVQMYGQFSGNPNKSGIFQDLPAQAGEMWQARIWSRNRPGDGSQGSNSAKLKIEFVDAQNVLLVTNEITVVTAASPQTYQSATIRREAPPGTQRARVVLEHTQVAFANGSVNFDNAEMFLVTVHDVRDLLNPGFEDGAGQEFPNWVRFGGSANVIRDPQSANARTGNSALQMFGAYTTNPNESGLYQSLPAAPGEFWQTSAYARNQPGDALQGSNRVFLSLQFLGASNVVLLAREAIMVDASSPTQYVAHALREAAPPGTLLVRMGVRIRQVGFADGSANVDDANLQLITAASQPALLNGGFEQLSTNSIPNWSGGPGGYILDPVGGNARSGGKALQMFGTATGVVSHAQLWQDLPVVEGQICQASAWARNRPSDGLQGANEAFLHLQFLGADGENLHDMKTRVADSTTPSTYTRHALLRPAPPAARIARMLLEVVQSGASPGSINFDDLSFGTVTALTGTQGVGRLHWSGILSPGLGEATTADDHLSLDPDTVLEMFVGGPGAATNYDQVIVGQTATLNGGLRILLPGSASGQGSSLPFVPRPGHAFELFRMGERNGLFAWLDAPSGWGGPAFTLDYSDTNVVLRVIREVDSDTDGIPDYWEVEHFGSRQGGDAATDSDQDGVPNADEFIADTAPTNPASYFHLSDLVFTNGVWSARLQPTSTNRVYDVLWRTNLMAADEAWKSHGFNQTGQDGELKLTFTNEIPDAVFRAGVRLP